jgi:hypothetical protein
MKETNGGATTVAQKKKLVIGNKTAKPEPEEKDPKSHSVLSAAHAKRIRQASDLDTEWEQLSSSSKNEVDRLVEVLKFVKNGDFSVRVPYEKGGILSSAGELINDIISG